MVSCFYMVIKYLKLKAFSHGNGLFFIALTYDTEPPLLLSPPPSPPSSSSVDSKLVFISHPETYSRTLVNYWFLIFGGSTSIYSFKLNSYLAPWVKLRYLFNFSFIWNLTSAHIPSLSHGKHVPNNSFLRVEYWVSVFFFWRGRIDFLLFTLGWYVWTALRCERMKWLMPCHSGEARHT